MSSSHAEPWPEFRGPTGQGISMAMELPVEWSTTKNVAWKQAVPGGGWSSPIVGRGQIFLTTAVAGQGGRSSLRVLAFEAASGRIAWNVEVFAPAEIAAQPIHGKNTEASPTPIVDGERIYVHFGHHGTACLDRAGKIVWRNNRLGYESVHGNGGSPILVGDKLIFHGDGAESPFVVALDKNTGEIVWKIPRPVVSRRTFSFSTPLLIAVDGGSQLISPASGAVFALNPDNGREIWRVRYGQGYSVVPRPVFGHGLVFVGTGFDRAELLAVRPDGAGDVTDTHIVWRTTRGAPLTPSLLLLGEELYAVNDAGIATCWDARTGKVHWQERLDGNYSASPVAGAG
ncbi:MAG: PQQ-binding-like beta-propeller repeat protein, partial [Opitutaceae bacterium]